jgi:hypothetical protein
MGIGGLGIGGMGIGGLGIGGLGHNLVDFRGRSTPTYAGFVMRLLSIPWNFMLGFAWGEVNRVDFRGRSTPTYAAA